MSAQPCGCDPEANYMCSGHAVARDNARFAERAAREAEAISRRPAPVVKDSGAREQYASGMVRDTTTDKIDYRLVFDGPMFDRWAAHLTAGAKKYDKRNWMRAAGEEEYDRFCESAVRHFRQWLRGDTDEDHAAAVFFNINGAEYTKERMKTVKEDQ